MARDKAIFIAKTNLIARTPDDVFYKKVDVIARYFDPIFVVHQAHIDHPEPLKGAAIHAIPRWVPGAISSLLFYLVSPLLVALLSYRYPVKVVISQSPFEAFGLIFTLSLLPASRRPSLVVEVHGDWRTATRLYGGRIRRLAAPIADVACAITIRRADRIRVIGEHTASLVTELRSSAADQELFIAFGDYAFFIDPPVAPLPADLRVAFVGVLELYKGVDVLLEAWSTVVEKYPQAELLMAGSGSKAEYCQRAARKYRIDHSVRFLGSLDRERVRMLLDESLFLVLPSRREGLGRVVIEAFARGRAVVGSNSGGIPELVVDGTNGVLVDVDDARALGNAMCDLLSQRELLETLGRNARSFVNRLDPDSSFEAGMKRLSTQLKERSA